MVNNRGDRKSPKDRVVGPLSNGLFMAYKLRVSNYLLPGMILQVRSGIFTYCLSPRKTNMAIAGTSPFLIGVAFSNRCFPIVMLVFLGVLFRG